MLVTWVVLAIASLSPRAVRAQTTDNPPVTVAPQPVSTPPAPMAIPPAGRAGPTEYGLGSLQLVLAYAVEIGGGYALAEMGLNHRDLGYQSDYGTLALAAAILPVLASAAVGGLGYTSRHYRGRWWTTLVGAYAGAALGALIGTSVAGKPGPDDTEAFVRTMTGLVGVVVLTPVGALAGYHLGKQPISPPSSVPSGDASSELELSRDRHLLLSSASDLRHGPLAELPARRLVLPLVNVTW
jgi:hypothetical protein